MDGCLPFLLLGGIPDRSTNPRLNRAQYSNINLLEEAVLCNKLSLIIEVVDQSFVKFAK
jgi:hypothetical protein